MKEIVAKIIIGALAANLLRVDVDISKLSGTMAYAEVYNMMVSPDDYRGKIVKMTGTFNVVENPETRQLYFCCLIKDATACCAAGFEFELAGDFSYPEDYPREGSSITVIGEFETYIEDGYAYCRLKNSCLQ